MKEVKYSQEYTHSEIADLKKENETILGNQEQEKELEN